MTKIDLKKEMRALYAPREGDPSEVDVPSLRALATSGNGGPRSKEYASAIEALFALAYGVRAQLKGDGTEYAVMPLETTWWAPGEASFEPDARERLSWRALIVQPEQATQEVFEDAREATRKKRRAPSALDRIELQQLPDVRAAQLLHVGPYETEGDSIARLHAFIDERGGRPTGGHHEVYLSNPQRTAAEKLKTILRQPFTRRDDA